MKKNIKVTGLLFALFVAIFTLGEGKASAAELDLTEDQKQDYYNQYEDIVDEINSNNPNSTLELVPFEDFNSVDYVDPKEFKEYAIERSGVEYVNVDDNATGIQPFSTVSKTKTKTVSSNGASATISVKGSFNTQYSDAYQRQMFGSINSLTSSSSKGTWRQTGYTPRLIDGGRTYEIIVGGKLTINSLTSSHNVTVEFYCSSTGAVS